MKQRNLTYVNSSRFMNYGVYGASLTIPPTLYTGPPTSSGSWWFRSIGHQANIYQSMLYEDDVSVYVIWLGYNDARWSSNTNLANFNTKYEEMVADIQNAAAMATPVSRILCLTPFNNPNYLRESRDGLEVPRRVLSVAQKGLCELVDVYNNVTFSQNFLDGDNVHLTKDGETEVANLVIDHLYGV